MNKLFLVILLSVANIAYLQSAVLKGYAPDFVGKTVRLFTYQDYVTMTKIQLGEGVVSPLDSSFSIPLKNTSTIKGIIEVDRTEAELYIAPKTSYQVYFTKSKDPISYKNATSNLLFFGLDSTDINYRILQYHDWFDTFVAYYERPIAQGQFLTYLDTFKLYAAEAYRDIKDVYFITYVRYDIAEMEQSAGGNKSSSARLNTFMNYIQPFPVYFENDRYMKFVLAFFNKDFGDYLPDTEASIMMAIYNSSPTRLMTALRSDMFLSNPELREMIMISKLGRAFYKEYNLQGNILIILDSISTHAGYNVNATTARNVKDYLTSLETGFPAPRIALQKGDEIINLGTFAGKFIYFNFFATWNKRSLAEMKILANLQRKYKEDIVFLSVCTDKERGTFDQFMLENPTYNWEIIYVGEDRELMNAYKVKDVPAYYLIDQDGFLFSSPALSPAPSGEYESIDKTFFYIQKALHPVKTPRVGEK